MIAESVFYKNRLTKILVNFKNTGYENMEYGIVFYNTFFWWDKR
jgi:hypothetical protein